MKEINIKQDCSEVRENMNGFLKGKLERREDGIVTDHLKHCEECYEFGVDIIKKRMHQ